MNTTSTKWLICAALTAAPATAQNHQYDPGWLWDSWEIRGGQPNSDYDVEFHNRSCTWYTASSGRTDGQGNDDGSIIRWGPNFGFGPFQDQVRIHYTSGPAFCTRVPVPVVGNTASGSRNSNVTASIVELPEEDPLYSGLVYNIAQNVPDTMSRTGQAGWLQDDSSFTLTLPDGFVFDTLPSVAGLGSDLQFGAMSLADPSTLTVEILSNTRTDPFSGLEIVADVWTPGGLTPGDYFCEITGAFETTDPGTPFEVTGSGVASGQFIGFTKVPAPSGVLVLAGGLLLFTKRS